MEEKVSKRGYFVTVYCERMRRKGAKETMKKAKTDKALSEEYQRFEHAVRQILSVPKSELARREAAYQRKKIAEKKRKAA